MLLSPDFKAFELYETATGHQLNASWTLLLAIEELVRFETARKALEQKRCSIFLYHWLHISQRQCKHYDLAGRG